MTHFSDLGIHCSLSECKQKDFLPFKCEFCKKAFCLEHRTQEGHEFQNMRPETSVVVCPICRKSLRVSTSEDPDLVWEQHARSSCKPGSEIEICPVEVCSLREVSTTYVNCRVARRDSLRVDLSPAPNAGPVFA